jgi:predicted PurR-regulated permease PerM
VGTDRLTDDTLRDNSGALRRLLLVLGVAVLFGLLPFLTGLIGSLILFVIARPVHRRLSRVVPPRVSALAITLGLFVIVLVPGTWFVSTVIAEARVEMSGWNAGDALAWLSRTPLGDLGVTQNISSISASILAWLPGRAFALFGGLTSTVLNVVIAFFGLYYLLLGATPLWARVKRLLPVSDDTAEVLAARFVSVTEALLLGTALTASLQGTVVGIAFAIVGLQPAVLWGFVTACASVQPLLGSALVWLPGSIILLFQHRPGAALFVGATGAGLASNIDNVVRLFIYRRVSGIHPMLTLVGAFAGLRLFGLMGAFLGPLILSYFLELLRVFEDVTRGAEGE